MRIPGILDEQARAPAQDVRTQHVLDGIEDVLVAHQLRDPGLEQVDLLTLGERVPAVMDALVIFESLPVSRRLSGRQHANGRGESISMKSGNLFRSEQFRHDLARRP